MQWWAGGGDDVQKPMNEYQSYVESILTKLPDSLQKLSMDVSLHDAHLRIFSFDALTKTLQLELDGFSFDETLNAYFDRSIQLTYEDVRAISSAADPETGLAGPHGYGDLGYDEVEILAPNFYEHRMLFSTGIELKVQFSNFSVFYEDKR
jgi:hypothetical protein